jgi:hypothetical protein
VKTKIFIFAFKRMPALALPAFLRPACRSLPPVSVTNKNVFGSAIRRVRGRSQLGFDPEFAVDGAGIVVGQPVSKVDHRIWPIHT